MTITWTCLPYDRRTRERHPNGLSATVTGEAADRLLRKFAVVKGEGKSEGVPIYVGEVIHGARIDAITL